MRLIELIIQPERNAGWGSKSLIFGDDITQLYGPNGCGKTPIIHSIAFAMGYPVRYREDILAHCESVVLKASHNDREVVFTRWIRKEFHIECNISEHKDSNIFYNEKDMSVFLFDFLGISTDALTSNKNEPAHPYVSTFFPLFYVDQDSGYTSAYSSPGTFIKDQYSEMIRLALNVPAKHSYERKKFIIEKKNSLHSTDISIVNKERFIESLSQQAGETIRSSIEIDRELEALKVKLDDLRSSHDAASNSDSVMAYMINEKQSEKHDVDFQIRDLESRVSDFNKIKEEIEVEINTLSLNEEARRLFSSFNDICSSAGCQLFLNSSESYGKNLLYLRDQIKDLDRNTKYQAGQLDVLKARYDNLSKEIESLQEGIDEDNQKGSAQGLVNTISKITKSIIDLQSEKEVADRIEEEKHSYVELLNRRERLQNDIASMEGGIGDSDLRVLEFRTAFKNKLVEWLDILSTRNVSRDIKIDSNFSVIFGTEKLTQFSGSTLLRVVLALKAAFFEIYLSKKPAAIEFLIFDTPRQHDIESNHFAAFISKLKILVCNSSARVIFSTTEYHYGLQEGDKEWIPGFPGEEQNMFLGTIDQLAE